MADKSHSAEDARLAALRRYSVVYGDDEDAFEHIAALVQASLSLPMAAISLVEFDRQWFHCKKGFEAGGMARAVAFCTHVVSDAAPLAIADTTADPRFRQHPLVAGPAGVRSYLGVPLVTPDGHAIGALCGFDFTPRTFTGREVELMGHFARLVVDEMELRQAASVDHLTGALVRRAFIARVDKLLAEARPAEAALAILDLDRFKTVNDTYGHAVGDEVLRGFAKHVMAWKRPGDRFGRLGGEEFALLMPKATSVEALERMEKLRSIVETMGVDAPVNVGVTCSIGLAPLSEPIRTTSAWLHVADRALYEAKVFGRNKTVIGDPDASATADSATADRRRVRDLPTESSILSPLTVMRWVSKVH